MKKIIIADSKGWFVKSLSRQEAAINGWIIITTREELDYKYLKSINPSYIFFAHWSWIVSEEIHNSFKCIVFHTAPLPYGKGGSPIQNLILKGFKSSPVCAIKMINEVDAGPIYCSETISLEGNIVEIFERIAEAIKNMIWKIVKTFPSITPKEQIGKSFIFKRLSKEVNDLRNTSNKMQIYDLIRMTDGLGYPRAYLNLQGTLAEFSNARKEGDYITAEVKFKNKGSAIQAKTIKSENLNFEAVQQSDEHHNELYTLLKKRIHNISNEEIPTFEEHREFVSSHPYLYWYIIRNKEGESIGDVYIMETNCVGVNLISPAPQNIKAVIEYIKKRHNPLPPIKSVRTAKFHINVSHNHREKIQSLEACDCNKIQITYLIN